MGVFKRDGVTIALCLTSFFAGAAAMNAYHSVNQSVDKMNSSVDTLGASTDRLHHSVDLHISQATDNVADALDEFEESLGEELTQPLNNPSKPQSKEDAEPEFFDPWFK